MFSLATNRQHWSVHTVGMFCCPMGLSQSLTYEPCFNASFTTIEILTLPSFFILITLFLQGCTFPWEIRDGFPVGLLRRSIACSRFPPLLPPPEDHNKHEGNTPPFPKHALEDNQQQQRGHKHLATCEIHVLLKWRQRLTMLLLWEQPLGQLANENVIFGRQISQEKWQRP